MESLLSIVSKPNTPNHFPIFTCHPKLSLQYRKTTQMSLQCNRTRRAGLIATIASVVLLSRNGSLNAFELRMTVPDQSVEEAESGIRGHALSLLQVKDLLESESWKEAQKELRKSSSKLKQDIYTIIQSKPPSQRPPLRKLYSTLFNSVTRLDYAARDKDATRVRVYYDDILVSLNDIMSRI
ncbi:psbQ-like protein 3, chloroplastic [Cornus florida]|uniref:psbQ-like protein 3, chloroplastic n=1 Tax=Cornus florida TaxID=4283 RepID=UPI0028A020A8|nr:psbQ-like protein 3, chloroplastic [Cornus florida]